MPFLGAGTNGPSCVPSSTCITKQPKEPRDLSEDWGDAPALTDFDRTAASGNRASGLEPKTTEV
jgi:hypothetical protein